MIAWKIVDVDVAQPVSLYNRVRARLEKRHKKIGSGLYSDVYDLGDRVAKLLTADDDGYLMYLKAIMSGVYNSPYLPKIYKVIHFRYKNPEHSKKYDTMWPHMHGHSPYECFLVIMEKLTGIQAYEETSYMKFSRLCRVRQTFADIMRNVVRGRDPYDYSVLYGKDKKGSKLSKKHNDLFAFLALAFELGGNSAGCDLHSGNVMLRGNQMVITDPFSNGGEVFRKKTLYD